MSLLLAFWHIGICLLLIASRQKKVPQNFWFGREPPPLWKKNSYLSNILPSPASRRRDRWGRPPGSSASRCLWGAVGEIYFLSLQLYLHTHLFYVWSLCLTFVNRTMTITKFHYFHQKLVWHLVIKLCIRTYFCLFHLWFTGVQGSKNSFQKIQNKIFYISSDRKCILCGSCHKLMLGILLIVGLN